MTHRAKTETQRTQRLSTNEPRRKIYDPSELPDICAASDCGVYLQTTPEKICRMCASGELPAFKLGQEWRICKSDLLAYVRGQVEARR